MGASRDERRAERARREQVDLPGQREVGEQRGGGAHRRSEGAPEHRARRLFGRGLRVGRHDARLDALQHAPLEMAQPPGGLAVVVVAAGIGGGVGGGPDAVERDHAGGQQRPPVGGDRGRGQRLQRHRHDGRACLRADLHHAADRRRESVKVHAHRVRAGGKRVEQEPPVPPGDDEGHRRAERRHHRADQRPAVGGEDEPADRAEPGAGHGRLRGPLGLSRRGPDRNDEAYECGRDHERG